MSPRKAQPLSSEFAFTALATSVTMSRRTWGSARAAEGATGGGTIAPGVAAGAGTEAAAGAAGAVAAGAGTTADGAEAGWAAARPAGPRPRPLRRDLPA